MMGIVRERGWKLQIYVKRHIKGKIGGFSALKTVGLKHYMKSESSLANSE